MAGVTVRDGETWRTARSLEVMDGETWRLVKAVWVRDGETWRKLAGILEKLYPDGDVTVGGWTVTPLWQKLDNESEADSINSPATAGNPPQTYTCEVSLVNPANSHIDGEPAVVRIRARKNEQILIGSVTIDLTVELRQGATLIASQQWPDIGTAYTTRSLTLSLAQKRNISDPTDLRIRISSYQTVPNEFDSGNCQVAWTQLKFS